MDLLVVVFSEEDVAAILSIPFIHNSSDKLIWHYTVNGKYSVKSGYWLSQCLVSLWLGGVNGSSNSVDLLWSSIWSLHIPNKLKVLLWRAVYDILPCKVSLFKRHIVLDSLCFRCSQQLQSPIHAL